MGYFHAEMEHFDIGIVDNGPLCGDAFWAMINLQFGIRTHPIGRG